MKCLRVFEVSTVAAVAVLICGNLAAQSVTSTAPPPTKMTAPAPQKHQAPGSQHPAGQTSHSQITAAPPPVVKVANGTIEGFVYWDTSHFSHVPALSCSGLAITVSVGSSNGPFTSYTPIGTLSNNFKYVGRVQLLSFGQRKVYEVCTYGFGHVPVGPKLQVKLTVTQPASFSPMAVPHFTTVGPIQIINARCNMLPNIVKPVASDLTAHWGSCQNMAYDVNFVMSHLNRPTGSGGVGSLTPVGSGK
jgi:hypothetical protein